MAQSNPRRPRTPARGPSHSSTRLQRDRDEVGSSIASPTRRNSDLRVRNTADVLELLRRRGRMSRADLAEHTTLSHQTLATILNDLAESGHVLEVETRGMARSRGRPALLYEYNPHRVSVVSLYIGLRYCEVSLCDGLGRPLDDNVELTPGWDVHNVVAESSHHIDELLDRNRIDRNSCRVAAVVHGSVSPTGVVSNRDMGWRDVALTELLERAGHRQVSVHEAARAGAIAEYREGAAAGAEHAIVFNIGPELVATAIRNGALDVGRIGLAGMIGRCTVDTPDGPRTIHESHGSFAAKQRYIELSGEHVDWVTEVFARARAGDPYAREVMADQVATVALASMWLITIGNPDRYVFTGAIGDYDERSKAQLHAAIVEHTDDEVLDGCSIQFSELGRQAWIRGGVHAALDRQREHDGVGRSPRP